jgi:hypothetical protein
MQSCASNLCHGSFQQNDFQNDCHVTTSWRIDFCFMSGDYRRACLMRLRIGRLSVQMTTQCGATPARPRPHATATYSTGRLYRSVNSNPSSNYSKSKSLLRVLFEVTIKMFVRSAVGLACLLQFINPTIALPAEQQPLQPDNSKGVQAVRAEYVYAPRSSHVHSFLNFKQTQESRNHPHRYITVGVLSLKLLTPPK